MDWTIFSYHNVEGLRGVLNAVAALFGAGDYKASLFIVIVFGFFAAALAYAFAPQKMQGWHWLASVVLVYSVLMLPKSTVQIVDVTADEAPAVVANVPYGLAVLAGVSSQVGHAITSLAEMAFSALPVGGGLAAPEELSYQRNGMMFGARMVHKSQKVAFRAATLRSDIMDFFSSCVDPELSSNNINPDDFMRATDVWEFLDGKVNPARFTVLASEPGEVFTCDDAYAVLSDRIDQEKPGLLAALAYQAHPTMTPAQALDRIDGEITAAYSAGQLAQASKSAGDIVAQNAVINAINDGSRLAFVRNGDTTGLLMNQAQSATFHQKNSAFISNAKIAEQALPVVRNVIEAISYALFPLVVLLLMLTSGRDTVVGIRNYASVLIWIQLWPPLYAVLNYMASIYASYDMAAAAVIDPASSARGVALATFGAINDNALSCQAVVGYLTFTIPFLAWSALKRMENFGTTVAGALTGVERTGDANASAASMGNMSWGSMSRNQANLSPSQSSPDVSRVQDANGTWTTTTANRKYYKSEKNDLPMSTHGSINIGAMQTEALSKNVQRTASERQSASDAASAAYVKAFSYQRGIKNGNRASESSGHSWGQDASQAFSKTSSVVDNLSKRINIGQGEQVNAAIGLALFGGKLGAGYAAQMGIQEQYDKAVQAIDKIDHATGRTFRESAMEEARREISTVKDAGTSVGRDASLASTFQRSFSADDSYQAAVGQLKTFTDNGGSSLTVDADLLTMMPELAEKIAHDIPLSPQDIQSAMAAQAQYISERLNLSSEMANVMNNPHRIKPKASVTSADGKPVTWDTDQKQQARDAAPPQATLAAGAQADVAAHDTANQKKVEEMGGPNAKTFTGVGGASAASAGSGRVTKNHANVNQQLGNEDGTVGEQTAVRQAAGALGKTPDAVMTGQAAVKAGYSAQAKEAARVMPGTTLDKNGDPVTRSQTLDLAKDAVAVVGGTALAVDSGIKTAGSMIDKASMVRQQWQQNGGEMTKAAVEKAWDQVSSLQESAKYGNQEAAEKLQALSPTVSYARGINVAPRIDLEQASDYLSKTFDLWPNFNTAMTLPGADPSAKDAPPAKPESETTWAQKASTAIRYIYNTDGNQAAKANGNPNEPSFLQKVHEVTLLGWEFAGLKINRDPGKHPVPHDGSSTAPQTAAAPQQNDNKQP